MGSFSSAGKGAGLIYGAESRSTMSKNKESHNSHNVKNMLCSRSSDRNTTKSQTQKQDVISKFCILKNLSEKKLSWPLKQKKFKNSPFCDCFWRLCGRGWSQFGWHLPACQSFTVVITMARGRWRRSAALPVWNGGQSLRRLFFCVEQSVFQRKQLRVRSLAPPKLCSCCCYQKLRAHLPVWAPHVILAKVSRWALRLVVDKWRLCNLS